MLSERKLNQTFRKLIEVMNINWHKRNLKKDIFFNEIPRMKVPSFKSKLCILVFAITLILSEKTLISSISGFKRTFKYWSVSK